MKSFVFVLLSCCLSLGLQAQTNFQLHLSQMMNNQPFALNTTTLHPGGLYSVQFSRFDYYISQISITHDGGQVTPMTGLYLLVHPAVDSVYELGAYNIDNVEAISFYIGVDSVTNHLDPSSYPSTHPLSPQSPTMHWGWAAGYFFSTINGIAGAGLANEFQIHSLGNMNYFQTTLPTGSEQLLDGTKSIRLLANYAMAIEKIDVSLGANAHGTTGIAAIAVGNLNSKVFSQLITVGTKNTNIFRGRFDISSNPSNGLTPFAMLDLPTGFDYQITISDVQGRTVYHRAVDSSVKAMPLQMEQTPGFYFVRLWQNGKQVAVDKLVINH